MRCDTRLELSLINSAVVKVGSIHMYLLIQHVQIVCLALLHALFGGIISTLPYSILFNSSIRATMNSLLIALLFAATAGGFPPKPRVLPRAEPGCTLEGAQSIMNSTITEFMALFTSPSRPSCYDWCTNACSNSPDFFPNMQETVSFQPACARHDFSWHNLKMYGAFDEETKRHADEHLRDGLLEACGTHKVCEKVWVPVYFAAVRPNNEPAADNNKIALDTPKETECTVFPGCCADHSSPTPCGKREILSGVYRGDNSCKIH